MEQGLENLRRLPSVQADIALQPGEREGESALEVKRAQSRPIRLSLSADDSGSEYTGKYQGTAALSLDNPLGLSDMLYAYMGHSLEGGRPYGTGNYGLHYSVPLGYCLLSVSTSRHRYHQTVAGYASDYEYSGVSRNTVVEFSRVIRRDEKGKTVFGAGILHLMSRNFLDGTEIEIQRRRMTSWEVFLNHHQKVFNAGVDFELRFHRGIGALGAIPAPEEMTGDGTARPEMLTLNLRLDIPFKLLGRQLRYSGSWRQQWAFRKLVSRDRLSIGGRYNVRGFDGEMTLSADNGYVFRNELSWAIPKIRQEFYAAADFGRVWGPNDSFLLGRSLAGAAVGLRGGVKNFRYDVFVSRPLRKPDRFPGHRYVLGFHSSIRF